MSDLTQTKVSYQALTPRFKSLTSALLSHLAFNSRALRVGCELSLCFLLFLAFKHWLPWSLLNVSAAWIPLCAWMAACVAISILDIKLFSHAITNFNLTKRYDVSGAYSKALDALDTIAPNSSALVKLAPESYHLLRSRILAHAEFTDRAQSEILIAASEGADGIDYFRQRIEIQRIKGDFAAAFTELEIAKQRLNQISTLALEEALLCLEQRNDLRKAKQLFQTVISAPSQPLVGEQTTVTMAGAFYAATMLWTGHAEEGLEALDDAIARVKVDACYCEDLAPHLSWLLLERAYYLVTHKEPEQSLSDYSIASQLCQYPTLSKLRSMIKDEFEWRYKIAVV